MLLTPAMTRIGLPGARTAMSVLSVGDEVFVAVSTLSALTFVFATLLVIAHRKLHVDEDPRIDAVHQLLPNSNCGACGFPGCRAFAEALVSGEAPPAKCTVSTADDKEGIAALLGVAVGTQEKVVARLACAGGTNVARAKAHYDGVPSCRAATLVGGGPKACTWGCLGLGDCEVACDFDAIHMDAHGLPVVDVVACTACGDCVDACPKDLFSLHPVSHRLWVACRNLEHGDGVLEDCEVACTACARCAMDAPDGLVAMVDNLPVVDYTRRGATQHPIERCPTGAIVWFAADDTAVKGRAAHKIVRQGERREATS